MATNSSNKQSGDDLTPEQFTLDAIVALRDPDRSAGIHSAWSGFNAAFRQHFGDDYDPIETTKQMAEDGLIETRFRKGGVMLYLPGEAPEETDGRANAALAKILATPRGANPGNAAARRNGPVTTRKPAGANRR